MNSSVLLLLGNSLKHNYTFNTRLAALNNLRLFHRNRAVDVLSLNPALHFLFKIRLILRSVGILKPELITSISLFNKFLNGGIRNGFCFTHNLSGFVLNRLATLDIVNSIVELAIARRVIKRGANAMRYKGKACFLSLCITSGHDLRRISRNSKLL